MDDMLAEVREELSRRLGSPCEDDERLFSTGQLDSLVLVDLIVWAERRYSIQIGPEDLSLRNFDSAQALATFLTSRAPQ